MSGGKEVATERLVEGSQGLFFLAKFRSDLLNKRLDSGLGKVTNQLPIALNDFYASELNRTRNIEDSDAHQNLARKMFPRILHTSRAQSPDEIAKPSL